MSRLRGKVPTQIKKRLKAFFYGAAGSGKTSCAMQFPSAYFIDTERGAENDSYVQMLKEKGSVLFQAQDFDEVYSEIRTLASEKHDFKTLVIDPITIIYNNLLEEGIKKVGEAMGKHYGYANKKMKSLIDLIMRLDMNVIITSHAKNEYGNQMTVLGQTFDAYKKLDYLFDLVIEIKVDGKKRMAVVRKSRISTIPDQDVFEFNYQSILSRYDKTMLEQVSIPIPSASEERIMDLISIMTDKLVEKEEINKWLAKAGVETLGELKEDQVEKLIKMLEERR